MIGSTWDPAASMRTLKYFLADYTNHKAIVHQLNFIVAYLQANIKYIVFDNLDSRYVEYFPEYANHFGRPLRLNKSMYGMTSYGKLFADELTNCLID